MSNFIQRIVGILEDVADMVGIGAKVAREVQDLASPESRQHIAADIVARGERLRAVRSEKVVPLITRERQ